MLFAPVLPAGHPPAKSSRFRVRAVSSAGEHYVDIVGVTGSIPVPPTIAFSADFRDFLTCAEFSDFGKAVLLWCNEGKTRQDPFVTSQRRLRIVRATYSSKRPVASRSRSYRLVSGNGGNQDSRRTVQSS